MPSSFNELTQLKELREHVGWVWYQTAFFVSPHWSNSRLSIRFGSVNYYASVVSYSGYSQRSSVTVALDHKR